MDYNYISADLSHFDMHNNIINYVTVTVKVKRQVHDFDIYPLPKLMILTYTRFPNYQQRGTKCDLDHQGQGHIANVSIPKSSKCQLLVERAKCGPDLQDQRSRS